MDVDSRNAINALLYKEKSKCLYKKKKVYINILHNIKKMMLWYLDVYYRVVFSFILISILLVENLANAM